ncbi:misexpression suppressor of ras 6 isoform X2 [Dermacentor variabilis]|uniref:misexpression suppressor of ras 6 isoform X2 n=1 Tax=Dermacentor variabilis TaxID=34621 RepID=UPI003F5B64F0
MGRAIPVHVVEPHFHALDYIYRAIGSKKLNFDGLLLIHFDAHPDLVIPPQLEPQKIQDREHVMSSIDIESWIMPGALAGHFDRLLWVRSPWSDQLPDGDHCFLIGEKDGRAKVSSALPYFLSECAWAPSEELSGAHGVTLRVRPLDWLLMQRALDETWRPSSSRQLVLDIDLDFYSTQDPFSLMFTASQMAMLRKLYHWDWPKDVRDAQKIKLQDSKNLEQPVDENSLGEPSYPAELVALCSDLKERPPIGETLHADLVHDAGCTCDLDSTLPHHRSSKQEVLDLIASTARFLQSLCAAPAVITIARSSIDAYCPPEEVDFIQHSVIDMLRSVYGELDVQLDYDSAGDA